MTTFFVSISHCVSYFISFPVNLKLYFAFITYLMRCKQEENVWVFIFFKKNYNRLQLIRTVILIHGLQYYCIVYTMQVIEKVNGIFDRFFCVHLWKISITYYSSREITRNTRNRNYTNSYIFLKFLFDNSIRPSIDFDVFIVTFAPQNFSKLNLSKNWSKFVVLFLKCNPWNLNKLNNCCLVFTSIFIRNSRHHINVRKPLTIQVCIEHV